MKYWAFLSYSHTDRKWGDWLHKALETYRVPRRLVGKDSRDGRVPERVFPVFRDREELPVSADLSSNINEALSESRYLIVICSPRAAQSRWVGEEIKTYKRLGRQDRILALIVEGEPNASDGKAGFKVGDECFPEAMRYHVRPDGTLSDQRTEPIAADAREDKDGKTNAKLKLLAGLLGVDYDALKQRDQERRLRRARTIVISTVVLLAVFAGLSVALFFKQREAARARDQAIKAQATAVEAERQTKLRASKADSDIAIRLARSGDEPRAFAHSVRALELNAKNPIAQVLAYRLLTDGSLPLPKYLLSHDSKVTALNFSRDGRMLATGCDNGSVRVLDLESGTTFLLQIEPPTSIVDVAFSPDGQSLCLASGSEGRRRPAVRRWNYHRSNQTTLISEQFRYWDDLEIAWPLADRIVAHSGRNWQSGGRLTQVFGESKGKWEFVFGVGQWLWDDEGEGVDKEKPPPPGFVQTGRIESWVIAPTGILVVYDTSKDRLSWIDLHGTPSLNKAMFTAKTPDHDVVDVATASGVAIFGHAFTDRSKLRMRRGNPSLGGPDAGHENKIRWADPRKRTQGTIEISKGVSVDRISANGETIVGLSSDGASILDRRTGKRLEAEAVGSIDDDSILDFSDDGNCAAIRSGSTSVITNRGTREADGRLVLPAEILAGSFDSANNWLAVSAEDKTVRVWSRAALGKRPLSLRDFDRTNEGEIREHAGSIYRLRMQDFTGTESQQNEECEICRVDPATGECKHVSNLRSSPSLQQTLHENYDPGITGYSFSPDGQRVAVAYGNLSGRPDNNAPSVAALYETATGRMIGDPLQHDDDVFSPCYAPNGEWFVTISDDRTVRRWNGKTGASIGYPLRLPIRGRFVQVSPDSRILVTSGGYLVDVAKWQIIKQLPPAASDMESAIFSPDGTWFISASVMSSSNGASTTQLVQWDLQNALEIGSPMQFLDDPTVESNTDDTDDTVPTRTDKARWIDPGCRMALESRLTWNCALPCTVESVLPLLQQCRPLKLGESGEEITNSDCSLEKITLEGLFPGGRTPQNETAWRFAERVLTQHEAPSN